MGAVPHPLDANYGQLKCKLEHVDETENDYKVIKKYIEATSSQWHQMELTDLWRMDRDGSVCAIQWV